MSKVIKRKNIIVKSSGTLHLLSGVAGPILTPFSCTCDTIMHLINTNKDVYEVLSDVTEVKLNKDNFNKDNSKKKEEVKKDLKHQKQQEVINQPIKEEKKEEVEQKNEEKAKDNNHKANSSNNNKYNKNNK